MNAVALLPGEGLTVRWRAQFVHPEVTDPRLISILAECAKTRAPGDPSAAIETLVSSFHRLGGKCSICLRPTCLDAIQIDPKDPRSAVDDWCLDAYKEAPNNNALSVAHRLCARLATASGVRSDDKLQQLNNFRSERDWLLSLRENIGAKDPSERKGGSENIGVESEQVAVEQVGGLYDRYVSIIEGLKSVIRSANEPPHSLSSRWLDQEKTLLEKRCHKTICCDAWRPASEFAPRREFKPGQIDSIDFFTCTCPRTKTKKSDAKKDESLEKDARVEAARAGSLDTRVGGAVEAARAMLELELDAGVSFSDRRQHVARAAYATHKRLLPLYAASNDLKVVLPLPPQDETAPQKQWFEQKGVCASCLNQIELHENLQWDVYKGSWCWMHSHCNPNVWKSYLSNTPLSEIELRRLIYRSRHETDVLFDQTIKSIKCSEKKAEMLEPLRQRAANLAEQALIQTRFGPAQQLRPQVQVWIEELNNADPEAAATIPRPPTPPKNRPCAKKRRRTSPQLPQ